MIPSMPAKPGRLFMYVALNIVCTFVGMQGKHDEKDETVAICIATSEWLLSK